MRADPLGRDWVPVGHSSRRGAPFRIVVARGWSWLRWAAILPFAYYFLLFLGTALPRMFFPFELEWLEGTVALHVDRLIAGAPLYAPPGEGWAAFTYPPFYYWVVSIPFRLFGFALGWGRLVSVLSTLALAAGTTALVRDHTRKWLPSVLAGLGVFAYYKPSGFWFDLFHPDMLALALLAWGAFFALKRRARAWQTATGATLLLLALLAKPTAIFPVALVILLLLLVRLWRVGRFALLFALVVLVNGGAIFASASEPTRQRWEWRHTYMVKTPAQRPFYWNRVHPEGVHPVKVLKQFLDAPGPFARDYLRKFRVAKPEAWWKFHTLLLAPAGLLFAWLVGSLLMRKRPRGGLWVLFGALLLYASLAGWVAYGGYVNNLAPAFWVGCVWLGLGYGGLLRYCHRRWTRAVIDVAVGFVLVSQYLPGQESRIVQPRPEGAPWALERHPFRFERAKQRPARGSVEAGRELVAWIEKQDDGVYVPHHPYLAHKAGKEPFYSIEAVRDLQISGHPIPKDLIERLRAGDFRYVILNHDLQHEWLPREVVPLLRELYAPAPFVIERYEPGQLKSVTGASMRPQRLFEWKAPRKAAPAAAP